MFQPKEWLCMGDIEWHWKALYPIEKPNSVYVQAMSYFWNCCCQAYWDAECLCVISGVIHFCYCHSVTLSSTQYRNRSVYGNFPFSTLSYFLFQRRTLATCQCQFSYPCFRSTVIQVIWVKWLKIKVLILPFSSGWFGDICHYWWISLGLNRLCSALLKVILRTEVSD